MTTRRYFPSRGLPTVKRCVEYLRHIGVDVSDETAQSWRDAEQVHRYLSRLATKSVREGKDMRCRNGHIWYGEFMRRGRGMKANNRKATTCPECGEKPVVLSLRWAETMDGAVKDYRPHAGRWRDRHGPPAPGATDNPFGL